MQQELPMATPIDPSITHEHLLRILVSRPTDYMEYGGEIDRWASEDEAYPDCSGGCIWAAWLSGELGSDWCVCTKPDAPRTGLLTFEHQAGKGCFEAKGGGTNE
jgi:hypothetical protein